MGRRTVFHDDYDGTEDETVETRRFSIGHQAYTIDLTADNYEKFLKTVDEWVSKATKEEAPARAVRGPAKTKAKKNDKGYSPADVRAWAATDDKWKGKVASRGALHKDLIADYEYAQGLDKGPEGS